jgi:hypothetical protein
MWFSPLEKKWFILTRSLWKDIINFRCY